MHDSMVDQIRMISSDILNIPLEQISADSSQDTLENWDSLQHINLIMALEQRFNVNITPEEIEKMSDIRQIANIVSSKLD